MIMQESALQHALLLHREPEQLFAMQNATLPPEIARLLRIVCDHNAAGESAADFGIDRSEMQQVAANYLRSICLYTGSDTLRCLGLNNALDLHLAKEHHRLFMKWLHPDRNTGQQALAERVNQAWTQLKNGRFNQLLPATSAWQVPDVIVEPQDRSRFPLFLWLLLAVGLILLALSVFWPEQIIYANGELSSEGAIQHENAEPLLADAELSNLDLPLIDWQSNASQSAKPLQSSSELSKAHVVQAKPALKPIVATNSNAKLPANFSVLPMPLIKVSTKQFASKNIPVPEMESPIKTQDINSPPELATRQNSESVTSMAEAMQVLQAFKQTYQSGQLTVFMSLFSLNARNDRGDRVAIAEDYERLFSRSRKRSLELTNLHWRPHAEGWHLSARYVAKVQAKTDLLPIKTKGAIELDFSQEQGRLRIRRIGLK